ncbi:MAG: hypothetical protein RXN88_03415 [Acidilobus sp.]
MKFKGSLAASMILAALLLLSPVAALAEGAHVSKANYIYVYPNSAVVVLVNGTATLKHEVPQGTTSIDVTYYSGSTYFSYSHSGQLPHHFRHHAIHGFNVSLEALQSSGSFNRTSSGRTSVLTYRSTTLAVFKSPSGTQESQANVSLYGLVEAMTSPEPLYLVTLSLNASHYPPSPTFQVTKYEVINVTGINATVKVFENATFVSVLITASVNATPTSPNTTLGLAQRAIEAALTPGFVNGSYSYYLNVSGNTTRESLSVNASDNLLNEASALLQALSKAAQQGQGNMFRSIFSSQGDENGQGAFGGLFSGLGEDNDLGDQLSSLQGLVNSSEAFINATEYLARYIRQNFRIVVPSSEQLNVTAQGYNVTFSFRSPMIIKAGATSPKQTLAAIQYLISNASAFYEQNGLDDAAKAIASIENEDVTLVGVGGVKVSPAQTTFGNLSSVTVTVPSGATPAETVIGGSAVVVALIVVAFFLIRRH